MTQKTDKEYIKQLEEHINSLEEGQFRTKRDCYLQSEWKTCCCTCKYQRKIMGHPWVGRTKSGVIFTYGCAARETDTDPEGKTHIVLNHEHGMCEMHTEKDNQVTGNAEEVPDKTVIDNEEDPLE